MVMVGRAERGECVHWRGSMSQDEFLSVEDVVGLKGGWTQK